MGRGQRLTLGTWDTVEAAEALVQHLELADAPDSGGSLPGAAGLSLLCGAGGRERPASGVSCHSVGAGAQ